MTIEQLKKSQHYGHYILVEDDYIEAGIYLGRFIGKFFEGYCDLSHIEDNARIDALELVEKYFKGLEIMLEPLDDTEYPEDNKERLCVKLKQKANDA